MRGFRVLTVMVKPFFEVLENNGSKAKFCSRGCARRSTLID
jgi:hypothetical protein